MGVWNTKNSKTCLQHDQLKCVVRTEWFVTMSTISGMCTVHWILRYPCSVGLLGILLKLVICVGMAQEVQPMKPIGALSQALFCLISYRLAGSTVHYWNHWMQPKLSRFHPFSFISRTLIPEPGAACLQFNHDVLDLAAEVHQLVIAVCIRILSMHSSRPFL